MNKIFKYILGIIPLILTVNLCSADLIAEIQRTSRSQITSETAITFTGDRCVMKTSGTMSYNTGAGAVSMNNDFQYCFASGDTVTFNGSAWMNRGSLVDYRNTGDECPTCPTCDEQYTSLECQTEYNLIPIDSVTANYCHVNFGLIDPSSCPMNEGTGAINWSSLYINNTQYSANDSIRLGIPEFIAWNLTYNTGETIVEIEGYNADTEYMDSIIAQTELTPTAEDFSTLVNGLQAYLPYFFIGLICLFFLGLVKKFFRG